jgi:hypothetical protein
LNCVQDGELLCLMTAGTWNTVILQWFCQNFSAWRQNVLIQVGHMIWYKLPVLQEDGNNEIWTLTLLKKLTEVSSFRSTGQKPLKENIWRNCLTRSDLPENGMGAVVVLAYPVLKDFEHYL